MSVRSLTIPPELVGERADKVVARLAGVSRQIARDLIEGEEGVEVDGRRVSASQRLEGRVVTIPIVAPPPPVAPEGVAFAVLHEDHDVLVVDKPAGVVVHPGAGRSTGTLVSGLLARYPELEGVGQADRWGLVHRLDKETSGVLLVARTTESYETLVAALAARRIHRSYQALVHGRVQMPTGTIDSPIGRDPLHPTKKKVVPDGRPSRTHYRVVWATDAVTLLEVTLETGRTHQIRVHMAAIGHPVVGDRTYSRRPAPLRRTFLHAAEIRFSHPRSGAEIVVSSPLPAELAVVADRLGRLGT